MRNPKPRYRYKQRVIRWMIFCFDHLGRFLCWLLRKQARPFRADRVKRILIIRLDHIGDLIMTSPAIANIHRIFPYAEIDFLIPKDMMFLFQGLVDFQKLIPFEHNWFSRKSRPWQKFIEAFRILRHIRKRSYDLAIDFRGDLRNILMMFLAGVEYRVGYGITGGGFLLNHEPEYPVGAHQVEANLKLIEFMGGAQDVFALVPFRYNAVRKQDFDERIGFELVNRLLPRLIIHIGAGYPSKRWPVDRFRELIAKILSGRLAQIILIGTADEKRLWDGPWDLNVQPGELIDLRGRTRLEDLPILMDQCDFFLGNDSGPAHLAAAHGLELLILFSGANDSGIWHPWTKRLHLIAPRVPCSPCESKVCRLKHHDCMQKISVDEVFRQLRFMLGLKG